MYSLQGITSSTSPNLRCSQVMVKAYIAAVKDNELRLIDAGHAITWEQRKVGDFLTESREAGSSGDVAKKLTVKLWGRGVEAKSDPAGS